MTIKSDQHGYEVQAARPALVQNVAIGARSTQSAAFSVAISPAGTYLQGPGVLVGTPVVAPNHTVHVRLCATADCYVLFGVNPVVTAVNGTLIPALTPEYFWVLPGEKLAVLAVSGTGALNIMECYA
jgi:hypothetical protein